MQSSPFEKAGRLDSEGDCPPRRIRRGERGILWKILHSKISPDPSLPKRGIRTIPPMVIQQ